MGIHTVAALYRAPPTWLRTHFGVVMERAAHELQGLPCLSLEQVAPAKQQIIASRSFGELVLTIDDLGEAVSSYTARAAEKLRRQHSVCACSRLAEHEAHRQSLEEKHKHAREALDHYRQSIKEQRDHD